MNYYFDMSSDIVKATNGPRYVVGIRRGVSIKFLEI